MSNPTNTTSRSMATDRMRKPAGSALWAMGPTGPPLLAFLARGPDSSRLNALAVRVTSLELARGVAALARRPWGWGEWQRMAGACYGLVRTVSRWRQIPWCARSSADADDGSSVTVSSQDLLRTGR